MNDELFHRFALVSSVTSGAVAGGVVLLLFAPRTWVGRTAAAAVAVAVMSGLTALLASAFTGWVAGGGVAAGAAVVLLSTAGVRRVVGRFAHPRALGGAALLAAFGVWGFEAWRFDATNEAILDHSLESVESPVPPVKTVAHAQTDRGGSIELGAPIEPLSVDELNEITRHSSAVNVYADHVITRGCPTDASNCHGWVFTGGRFHVRGLHVDTILSDNGYERVQEPAVGDLCVYRNPDGVVSHTAIVRARMTDGTVLVEGKWGRLGVYLHGAENSCYGTVYSFFHTARGSHLLNGLDDGSTVESASDRP